MGEELTLRICAGALSSQALEKAPKLSETEDLHGHGYLLIAYQGVEYVDRR